MPQDDGRLAQADTVARRVLVCLWLGSPRRWAESPSITYCANTKPYRSHTGRAAGERK